MTITTGPSAARMPRGRGPQQGSGYGALLQQVKEAGLLERRTGFYLGLVAVLVVALAATMGELAAAGDSWWCLAAAGVAGVLAAQLGFVAHEAAHREVFTTGRANDRLGLVVADLVVGISYTWWRADHLRHHTNPNLVGGDPSVERGAFAFTPEDAGPARGPVAWYTRRQGWFFFPLLTLAGLSMQVQGVLALLRRGRVERRWTELGLLAVHYVGSTALLLSVLPLGKAAAFAGLQVVTFGFSIASAFVPNHIGMPVLPRGTRLDFLSRQVLVSRNIRGGALTTAWMGGLNYQIEHHLFPSMPRPSLARAREITRTYCAEHGVPYTETGLGEAYGIIVRHLNEVGLAAGRHPFRCPAASALGR